MGGGREEGHTDSAVLFSNGLNDWDDSDNGISVSDDATASCIYTQKENKKIRKPQAADQTAFIFARLAAARLFSINSIRRLCWS